MPRLNLSIAVLFSIAAALVGMVAQQPAGGQQKKGGLEGATAD